MNERNGDEMIPLNQLDCVERWNDAIYQCCVCVYVKLGDKMQLINKTDFQFI